MVYLHSLNLNLNLLRMTLPRNINQENQEKLQRQVQNPLQPVSRFPPRKLARELPVRNEKWSSMLTKATMRELQEKRRRRRKSKKIAKPYFLLVMTRSRCVRGEVMHHVLRAESRSSCEVCTKALYCRILSHSWSISFTRRLIHRE